MTWSPPRLTAQRPVTSYRLSYGHNLDQLKSVGLPSSVRSYLIRDVGTMVHDLEETDGDGKDGMS